MRKSWLIALLACLVTSAAVSTPQRPTLLRGRLSSPVDASPIAGATVRLGTSRTTTAADGSFSVELQTRRSRPLRTRITAPGYRPYRSWTEAAAATERDVYLFPAHEFDLSSEQGPVTPAQLRTHFDYVYRDPLWTDPQRKRGRLQRWMERPVVRIDTRVLQVRYDPEWHWVAGEPVPGRVRRHVVRTIRAMIGPFTGGFLEGVEIRFRRMSEGETIASGVFEDVAGRGELRIAFHDLGYWNSGGAAFVENDVIVSGAVVLDLATVTRNSYGRSDFLTSHELAHSLGMSHPMEGQHGRRVTLPICSIMQGCRGERRPPGVVYPGDRLIARLAYSRLPGNDRNDRDARPSSDEAETRSASSRSSRLRVFHVGPDVLPGPPGTLYVR